MTKPDLGSLSGNQVPTYQENRAERMPDTTFHTKAQLRKLLYFIWSEKLKAQKDSEKVLNELLVLRKELATIKTKDLKIAELENESDELRKKLLAFQAMEINQLKERLRPEMKIAV